MWRWRNCKLYKSPSPHLPPLSGSTLWEKIFFHKKGHLVAGGGGGGGMKYFCSWKNRPMCTCETSGTLECAASQYRVGHWHCACQTWSQAAQWARGAPTDALTVGFFGGERRWFHCHFKKRRNTRLVLMTLSVGHACVVPVGAAESCCGIFCRRTYSVAGDTICRRSRHILSVVVRAKNLRWQRWWWWSSSSLHL